MAVWSMAKLALKPMGKEMDSLITRTGLSINHLEEKLRSDPYLTPYARIKYK